MWHWSYWFFCFRSRVLSCISKVLDESAFSICNSVFDPRLLLLRQSAIHHYEGVQLGLAFKQYNQRVKSLLSVRKPYAVVAKVNVLECLCVRVCNFFQKVCTLLCRRIRRSNFKALEALAVGANFTSHPKPENIAIIGALKLPELEFLTTHGPV